MTDRELLELIASKVTIFEGRMEAIEGKVETIESDMKEVKRDIRKLNRNDEFILDEVERVHEIFDIKYKELKEKIS